MKHFIITRNLYKDEYPNKQERLELIRRITIPSLRRQTNKDFVWILTGAEGLASADFEGIQHVVDPKFEKYIISVTEAGEKIITTRLDNDDYLLPTFVDDVQRVAADLEEGLIDAGGYRVDMRYKAVYQDTFYRSVPSPFLSVVEIKKCKRCRVRTAYYDDHTLMHHHFPLTRTKRSGWVQVIHGLNKIMSRPEEDVRKRGKLLETSYDDFLREMCLDLPHQLLAGAPPQPDTRPSGLPGATRSLADLALEFGTDKLTHGYLTTYEKYLAPRRQDALTIVEIGLKKRAKGVSGCESLRMWREYFPNARVIGLDIIDVSTLPVVERTEVYQCDGTDPRMLASVFERHGIQPDILIDDGAHTPRSHQVALGVIFPRMRSRGIYFIEDLQVCINPNIFARWDVTPENNTITYLQKLQETKESKSTFLDDTANRYLADHVGQIAFENRFYMAVLTKK
ncbi:hypothetical protein [Variovorax sp. YR752]|uniref:hypothetical protein n=1 Tax=Variovorax sp. YR752 TaxID=1884383 RepID=UPI003137DAF5